MIEVNSGGTRRSQHEKAPVLKKPIPFGKYFLLDRINVGGMAEVFRAKTLGVEGFERVVALKRILPNIAEDEEFITMFIDEAKIAVQLSHANIAQIFDLGRVEDSHFIALEFVHGKDLRYIYDRCKQKLIDGSPVMPVAMTSFVVMKACEGLDYAHNKRDTKGQELHLVHRDVSPQNILISYDGEVKLIDFGIAKAAGKASKTQQGILKGKFGYMSPEQVRGLPVDRRSDIFSLGILLYELLTGERLFVGESDFATLEKVRNVEILPPSTYNRKVGDELERIVMKALAKDVEDRYQNAIDLHDDLQAWMYSSGEFYARKDLAAYMKRVFGKELIDETARMGQYQAIPALEGSNPSAQMPTPPGASGRRPSGQMPVQAKPRHVVAEQTAKEESGLAWDDEELATNIYDTPPDMEDSVVDEEPEPETNQLDIGLIDFEPAADGGPVLHASASQRALPLPKQPTKSSAQPVVQARKPAPAPAPAKKNGAPQSRPVVTMTAPSSPEPRPRSGGPEARRPTQTVPVVNPRMLSPLESRPLDRSVDRTGSTRPARAHMALYVGGAVALLLGVLVTALFVYMGRRPGEVVVTSEPATSVRLILDEVKLPVDGTPATVKLEPGVHKLRIERDGYVTHDETLTVQAGERQGRYIVLELVPSNAGFKLISDPPGAEVFLDGKPLGGVTPLQAQGLAPGKHHLEVKSATGTWAQDVTLEAGGLAEIRATLPGAKPIVPTPVAPTPTPKPVLTAPKELPRLPPEVTPTPEPKPETKPRPEPKPRPVAVRPEPKPEPKPAPAGGGKDGFLRVNSKPWTNITVDGKDTGLHTPQTALKLSAGSHKVTLSNPQFNIKESFTVEIKAGESDTVIKDFRPKDDNDE